MFGIKEERVKQLIKTNRGELERDIDELKESIAQLKKKVVAPQTKHSKGGLDYFAASPWSIYSTRDISLEEKVDALAKHLGVSFDVKSESEEVVVKKTRMKRKPKKRKAKKSK